MFPKNIFRKWTPLLNCENSSSLRQNVCVLHKANSKNTGSAKSTWREGRAVDCITALDRIILHWRELTRSWFVFGVVKNPLVTWTLNGALKGCFIVKHSLGFVLYTKVTFNNYIVSMYNYNYNWITIIKYLWPCSPANIYVNLSLPEPVIFGLWAQIDGNQLIYLSHTHKETLLTN